MYFYSLVLPLVTKPPSIHHMCIVDERLQSTTLLKVPLFYLEMPNKLLIKHASYTL